MSTPAHPPASSPTPQADSTSGPDYDSPWKEAIGAYFPAFVQLFFQPVHARIDWNQPYEFLDAELRKITGDSEIGKRFADRLARVRGLQGEELWLLIHIEVQGKADVHFNHRMFQYYYRIHDRYADVEIISLALVTNQRDCSGLGLYAQGDADYGLRFRFRVHNLQEWNDQWDALKRKAATNPFAVVALAQLAAHRRSTDPERKASKREIIWLLYQYRHGREDVLKLLRFIDWMLRLPRALELELRNELLAFEESTNMSYVMSYERMALERGEERGEERGRKLGETKALLRQIQVKFGALPPEQIERIQSADTSNWKPGSTASSPPTPSTNSSAEAPAPCECRLKVGAPGSDRSRNDERGRFALHHRWACSPSDQIIDWSPLESEKPHD